MRIACNEQMKNKALSSLAVGFSGMGGETRIYNDTNESILYHFVSMTPLGSYYKCSPLIIRTFFIAKQVKDSN